MQTAVLIETQVPVGRILSDPFTSREVGTATSRPLVACPSNQMAHLETPSDRGSDLPLARSEAQGRNSLRGPGFFQTDVSVAKNIPLKESSSIQFRADIFNLFNKVNLDNPIPCVDCPDGGTIINTAFNGAALQRQIMFSLRFEF